MKNAIHHLNNSTLDLLRSRFKNVHALTDANKEMLNLSCVDNFFLTESDLRLFLEYIEPRPELADTKPRREYGDFQTPLDLCQTVCSTIKNCDPSILVEPTFGKGSFILTAIETFPTLKHVYGVEIHESYCWHTKFAILELFLDKPNLNHPLISLYCDDVFKFDFQKLNESFGPSTLLVLGNPPWVTNSELSVLKSNNLPTKSNFKSHNGLDAITGKGNFDIGEYIILMMLDAFSERTGSLAMLAKNTVIKNVVQDLPNTNHSISNLLALKFDTKQYFNAAVDASLFKCSFGQKDLSLSCKVAPLDYPASTESVFGWVEDKFVSDIDMYKNSKIFDSTSPFVWRQGVKHDCSKILELDFVNGLYKNGFADELDIEDDLIYPLVKSSDIQNSPLSIPRKFVIVTQKKVGEDITYIANKYPRLNQYLSSHLKFFSDRKSSIYNGKSEYAIFGIGEYSFKPFKVAISGLYKKSFFSLVKPYNGKPTMLDDTCYFLGFDDYSHSIFASLILNSEPAQNLLRSLSFIDSKRPYTKDILMRVDLLRVANYLGFNNIYERATGLSDDILQLVTQENWEAFLSSCNGKLQNAPQFSLTFPKAV